MHLCYEILSLILLPLLLPLAAAIVIIVIIVIIHLIISTSPALLFYARSNPATPSPQSQRQIVSFLVGWSGRTLRPPHHLLLMFVCC
jgi:hypothetical protein